MAFDLQKYQADYRAKNREKARAYQKDYRRKNAGKLKAYHREWFAKNYTPSSRVKTGRDKSRKRVSRNAWARRNVMKVRASIKKSKGKRPAHYRELGRISQQRRKAKKLNLPREHIRTAQIASRDFDHCHLCHQFVPTEQRSLDHLIPVCRGGPFTKWNIALAHLRCNRLRGAEKILPTETEEAATDHLKKHHEYHSNRQNIPG